MFNWNEVQKVVLGPNATMEKVIHILDREALRIVMVADEQNRLLGTITDGDVRRALIHHYSMSTPLSEIMFRDPTVAFVGDDSDEILSVMKRLDILQVPILDADRKIVGLETIHQLLKSNRFDNPVFLMAGGFGERLKPLTNDLPKPLLKIGNKPILETILIQFIELGFYNFFISTYFKAELISQYFGDGSKWGVNIQYVYEEKPLGTAGALGLLPKNLPDLPIIMMNGDLLTKVNFESLLNFHDKQGGVATMCVREHDLQVPYGVIMAEEQRITSIVEKPTQKFFINAGIYVLSPSLVRSIEGGNYLDMPNLLEDQIENNGLVNMFPVFEYWLDIGQIEQFKQAQSDSMSLFK